MANRRDTFYGQLVTDADTDQLCDDLEQADRDATVDLGFVGVVLGLDVGEHTPHNLTVDVTAGTSYDPDGQRCHVPSTQTVDLSVDHLSASTAVSTSGKTKVVSLFLKFSRALSNPKTDDNGNTVYYDRAESYTFYVVQGAESSSTPTPPALLADGILLADVTLSYSQTQIINANISTTRRQNLIAISDSPHSLAAASYMDALTDLLAIINDHVAGAADKHAATVISTTQGPVWANADNADKIAAGYVQDYVDTIVAKLAATTASHSGGHLIGVAAQTGAPGAIGASTLYDRLEALRLAANLSYAGGPTWFDLSTNPAASVEAQLDKIIVDLASSGASYGALKISCYARTTWLGGRTNPSASTWAAIDKIITDLSATTSSDDGAERIGAQASGGLSSGSVRSQLDELDTNKAALAGATFTGATKVPQVVVTGVTAVGTIAANTQIAADIGLVTCTAPSANNANYNLAMPNTPGGDGVVWFVFTGFGGTGKRVWITNTANLAVSTPTDYFCYWDASTSNARLGMIYDGTRWRVLHNTSMSGTAGGGALAD